MNSPLFSVVIPAYNRAKVIPRAVDSVLAQTFADFEIVVIDDGSTDNLREACEKYGSPQIHYYHQPNAGSNPARNMGVKMARGYYLSFLDSDDTWEPQYLHEVLQKFESDSEIGFVWVKRIKKHLPGGRTEAKEFRKLEGFVYKEVLQQGFLINSSCVTAKRSLVEAVGAWDNNLQACQDDDLCFRLTKATKVGYVNKALSIFYIDSSIERISSSGTRRAWNSLFLWRKFAKDVISHCGKRELEKKIAGVYLRFMWLKDKEGLVSCEKTLIELLDFTNTQLRIFRLRLICAKFMTRLKNAMKSRLGRLFGDC